MGKKNAEEMKFWTLSEYALVAGAAMEEPRAYYPFQVLYWCGIRIGELFALTYSDIDFEKKTLNINKSLQRLKGEIIVTDPKTPKSKRVITLPDFLCCELKEYMALQYSIEPTDRVFSLSKAYLGRQLKKYAEAVGMKAIRVHDLRHSHISHLIDLGFSAVAIAERAGHESIEITYRYAHLFPTKQEEMAEKLNAAVEEFGHAS